MSKLPDKPFTTRNFSPEGGGIDFLGLRWVNLTMVGQDLIPEINNVTRDMGTFFLAAWIPWKFRQLCRGEKEYTEKNYKAFREKVEVAISLTLRDDLGYVRPQGQVRNRVGITQKCNLPGKLSFENAERKNQNSLYAAAIYGPALKYLGFVRDYHSLSKDGIKVVNVAIPGGDSDTQQIMAGVDKTLKTAPCYELLASLDSPNFDQSNVAELAKAGLDPAIFRDHAYDSIKECFLRKLLPPDPDSPGHARTLTARLLLETLRQGGDLSTDEVRNAWYTGMFGDGRRLILAPGTALGDHCLLWSCFMARQYQRYSIELFLWCFEDALRQGCRTIDGVVDYWIDRSDSSGVPLGESFQFIAETLAGADQGSDPLATSQEWNRTVHASIDRFEYAEEFEDDTSVAVALKLFAGWYWRMFSRRGQEKARKCFDLGGTDRMSMTWFINWLHERRELPIRDFLRDVFSGLVFSQHMRVALARFDGTSQRLRFLMGDSGIEPTLNLKGDLSIPWMPDRLDTLVELLLDCDVLIEDADAEAVTLGPRAADVT